MESSIVVCAAQRMVSRLQLAVMDVIGEQKRLVEENLFRFRLADTVFFSVFAGISRIPLKTGNLGPVDHFCILSEYTSSASGKSNGKNVRF